MLNTQILNLRESILRTLLPWTYKCDVHKRCVKDGVLNEDIESIMVRNIQSASISYERRLKPFSLQSLGECKLTCGRQDSVLWPKPQKAKLGRGVAHFHQDDIFFINEQEFEVLRHKAKSATKVYVYIENIFL